MEGEKRKPEKVTPKKCPTCKTSPLVIEDAWKNYRCYCPTCYRWESKANETENKAVISWNSSING